MDLEINKTPKLSSFNRRSTAVNKTNATMSESFNQYHNSNLKNQLFKNDLQFKNNRLKIDNYICSNSPLTDADKLLANNQLNNEFVSNDNFTNYFYSPGSHTLNDQKNHNIFSSSAYNHSNIKDEHLELVKSFADDIIKKKDLIIESQKNKIEELDRYCELYQLKLLDTKYRSSNEGSQYDARMQSSQSSQSYPMTSASDLDRQLCAVEYEFDEYRKQSSLKIAEKDKEIIEIHKLIKQKDDRVCELTKETEVGRLRLQKLEQEVSQHIDYISHLPTSKQHQQNTHMINTLTSERDRQKETLIQLNAKLVQLSQSVETNKNTINNLNIEKINDLDTINNLKSECSRLKSTLEENTIFQDLENLKKENNKISSDLENQKKMSAFHLKQMHEQLKKEKKERLELVELLDIEQTNQLALNASLESQQEILHNCQRELKQLSEENQVLLLQNATLQEQLKLLSASHCSDKDDSLLQQIIKDLKTSLKDLLQIVKFCFDKFHGQQIDIISLFGSSTATNTSLQSVGSAARHEQLQKLSSDIKDMRSNIDKLQEVMLDYLAEDVANNQPCNQQ